MEGFKPPVIDLRWEEERIISAIDDACRIHGFFIVTHHGVQVERIRAARNIARQFFALPEEQKLAYPLNVGDDFLYGYCALGREKSDIANLSLTGDEPCPKDLMESFQVADPDMPAAVSSNGDEAVSTSANGLNRFPRSVDGMQEVLESLYRSTRTEAARLLRLVGKAIGAPENYFEDGHEPGQLNRSVLRMTRYPALHYFGLDSLTVNGQPVLRIGPHRDLGTITLLFQDDQGGLQVQLENGEWVDCDPVLTDGEPTAIVVNLGNLAQRWCNQVYRSSVHRVVANENSLTQDRYSLILFVNPNESTVVEPLPSCVTEENPALYVPIVTQKYMSCKFTQLFDPKAKEWKGKCIYDD